MQVTVTSADWAGHTGFICGFTRTPFPITLLFSHLGVVSDAVGARVVLGDLNVKMENADPMFDQCWASVVDGGPTLVKHWVDVSCLLGYSQTNESKIN